MISAHSRTDEWIISVRGRVSPELTEKMILAFTLVEMLQESGLPFIFKGGTSLSLVTGTLKRFSTDIDIVCAHGQPLEPFFKFVLEQGVFTRIEEDKRVKDLPGITHHKFFYTSLYPSSFEKEHHILLDILFEDSLYAKTIPVALSSPILEIEGKFTQLHCPSPECLCGDKLTAFAPHTTGKHFSTGMELEIVKQLHDVAVLFDYLSEIEDFFQTYGTIATAELSYRDLNMKTTKDVALDTFETACNIGLRGKTGKENDQQEFAEISSGISKLAAYIYQGKSNQETAILSASKTAYLCALFLNRQTKIIRYSNDMAKSLYQWTFDDPILSQLNPLRKTNLEAFYYFHQAFDLLGKTSL